MASEDRETLDINYLKSPHFREVTSDGIVGGPTPMGKIWLAFFTERFALPRIVRHELEVIDDATSRLADDGVVIEGRDGLVRTVEFGVYLTPNEARGLVEWLNENIKIVGD